MLHRIEFLDEIIGNYQAIFCDIWGVLHDGRHVFQPAVSALEKARNRGVFVLLLTNAPRLHTEVSSHLQQLGIKPHIYNDIVTSGDVTRKLIENSGKKIFHIGPACDASLYADLNVRAVSEEEAETVVCTGLFDEKREKPEDYADMLKRLRIRELPFICANPDFFIRQKNTLIWCAGALAREYEKAGGTTLQAGKPHPPIYALASQNLARIMGKKIEKEKILAIGDNMLTDTRGAAQNGLDILYVANGVHLPQYATSGKIDEQKLDRFFSMYKDIPKTFVHELK